MMRKLGFDQDYEQLKEIGLVGTQFVGLSYALIKKYIQTLMFTRLTKDQFKQILAMLNDQNKDSKNTLKILIMLNITIHVATRVEKLQFDEQIAEEINKLIKLEHQRYERTQKKRNKQKERGFSIEKTVGWIKSGIRQTFSRSKDKPEKTNLSLNKTKLKPATGNQVTQNLDTPVFRSERIDSQTEVKGKQQVLICELIIPYATYLLKLTSSQINLQKEFSLPNLKTQHLWKIVNLLNYLLKVNVAFNTIMRYYQSDYQFIIDIILRSMDNQIKLLYPLLQKSISRKFQLFKKQTLEIYQGESNLRAKAEKIEQMVYKYEVIELKQIIQEIARLNEQIQKIYLGKYIYNKVRTMGLCQPSLIEDSSFDLIFDVIREVQKNKSVSKRKSSSKQKKEKNQPTFNHKPDISNQMKSSFTQKKLKIMTSQDRKIFQEQEKKVIQKNPDALNESAPVIGENQSTFRKMRMNMTGSHIMWEQTNTRRLKL